MAADSRAVGLLHCFLKVMKCGSVDGSVEMWKCGSVDGSVEVFSVLIFDHLTAGWLEWTG